MGMNETNLTTRQKRVLEVVGQANGFSRLEIEEKIKKIYPISKPTLIRDLNVLVKLKVVKSEGNGKNTRYFPVIKNPLLRYFDIERYFSVEPDRRENVKTKFNFEVFKHLSGLIDFEEKKSLDDKYINFSNATENLSKDILKRELERFIIELSWKSSRIEGNTYSLLETETLIKQSIEAVGHTREEAVMILNHKKAFESILSNRFDFKKMTKANINQLHNLMVKDMGITAGVREQAVGITGTTYRPLDNKWQIEEALEKLVAAINKSKYPLEKALIANSMISYIQPFSDGNKRTGRMLANAILLAYDYYPLSYRSVDENTFKKALILFYEQNSMYSLKKILLDQYLFALKTYFVDGGKRVSEIG